jgi:hypothetical protein
MYGLKLRIKSDHLASPELMLTGIELLHRGWIQNVEVKLDIDGLGSLGLRIRGIGRDATTHTATR